MLTCKKVASSCTYKVRAVLFLEYVVQLKNAWIPVGAFTNISVSVSFFILCKSAFRAKLQLKSSYNENRSITLGKQNNIY